MIPRKYYEFRRIPRHSPELHGGGLLGSCYFSDCSRGEAGNRSSLRPLPPDSSPNISSSMDFPGLPQAFLGPPRTSQDLPRDFLRPPRTLVSQQNPFRTSAKRLRKWRHCKKSQESLAFYGEAPGVVTRGSSLEALSLVGAAGLEAGRSKPPERENSQDLFRIRRNYVGIRRTSFQCIGINKNYRECLRIRRYSWEFFGIHSISKNHQELL